MTAYASDTLKTCDVFNTIAKQWGADAAAKFMRDVNRTRIEREIEGEQERQRQLIAHAKAVSGKRAPVNKRDPWMVAQDRVTQSFNRMDKLLAEYDEACK